MRVYACSSKLRPRFLCVGRIGANRDSEHAILAQRLTHDLGVPMEPAQTRAVGGLEKEFERDTVCREPLFDFDHEAIKPLPASGGDEYRASHGPLAFGLIAQSHTRFAGKKVDLVPNLEQPSPASFSDTQLGQDLLDVARLCSGILVRAVPHVQDPMGFHAFFGAG